MAQGKSMPVSRSLTTSSLGTKQGDYLLDKFNESLSSKLGPNFKKNLKLKFAELGNNAGMLGATYLLLKKVGRI